LERRPPGRFPWRLDTGFSYSDFSRESRSAWHEGYLQLGYALDESTSIHVRSEISERFDEVDSYFEGGINHRYADWASAYFSFGGTPEADFRERWAILTGGALRFSQGVRTIGPSLAILDFKQAQYASGDVQTIKPGLQQFFWDGRAWITAQAIVVIDEDDTVQTGWSARIDFMPTDSLTVYAGYIRAAETQANETVDTDTLVAGLVIDVTERIGLRIDYTHDDRESSYIRNAVNVGATLRF
jgi:YaiO family outer membrane protein